MIGCGPQAREAAEIGRKHTGRASLVILVAAHDCESFPSHRLMRNGDRVLNGKHTARVRQADRELYSRRADKELRMACRSSFDYAGLLRPGLPPAAAKWTGFPKYNFVGGHNDADSVPVEDLIAAATSVLQARGQDARDLRPRQRRAGLSAVARVHRPQARRRRRHRLLARRDPDHLGLAAGARSRQSGAALAGRHGHRRADDLRRRAHAVAAPGREHRGRCPSITTASAAPRSRRRSRISSGAASRPSTSTRFRPCRIPTATVMSEARRAELLAALASLRRADLRGRVLRRSHLGREAAACVARHGRATTASSTSARSRRPSHRRCGSATWSPAGR